MSTKSIEDRLENTHPNPSPRFYRRMARAPWAPRTLAVRRGLAAAGAALLLAAGLLIFTPQGQVLAREITHFFTRSSANTVPVTPISQTPTQDPGFVFNQEIAEVGQQAGFSLLEPTWLPVEPNGQPILSFSGASIEPDHAIVRIFYSYYGTTDGLVLREQPLQTEEECVLCGMVGSSALIESVQIGDSVGEYVQGVWKADDQGHWSWTADPYVKTLRFEKGDLALELQYFGQEIEKADLVAIAESLK
jgi:hypothetical protein